MQGLGAHNVTSPKVSQTGKSKVVSSYEVNTERGLPTRTGWIPAPAGLGDCQLFSSNRSQLGGRTLGQQLRLPAARSLLPSLVRELNAGLVKIGLPFGDAQKSHAQQ